MNLLRLRTLVALALASVLTALVQAQPAARTFTSTFVFGDSLSDTGNLFAAIGTPPPPYFNGRFSNGPVYADILVPGIQNALTAPSTVNRNLNFAFAGATAIGSTPIPASLPVQVGLYQARGITAAPTDLYIVLAGANDVLNTIGNPATQNDPAVSAAGRAAAASVVSSVQALAASGARNVVVLNLPNLAQTPRFTTGSAAAANSLAQSGTLAFNEALKGNLGGAAFPSGMNITLVNLQAFLNVMVRNPAAFGFTVTNRSILDILTAGGTPGPADGFIFFDSIHPTTKTHAILAGALQEMLNPEFVLGTAGTQGTALISVADMAADSVDSRLDRVRVGTNRHSADGYISYSHQDAGRKFNGYQPGFDFIARVYTAGFDVQYRPGVIVGLAFNQETVNSNIKSGIGRGSFKLTGTSGVAYAQLKSGANFAEASLSYGGQDIRQISRTTALGGFRTTGENTGSRYGASIKVGRDFHGETMHFTPFVGLRYMRGRIDRYSETGVTGLDFAYGEQDLRSLGSQFGANFDFAVNPGGLPLVLGLTGVYSVDMVRGTRGLTGRLADNLTQPTSVQVSDGMGNNLKIGARASGKFGQRWHWSAGMGTEMRNDGKDSVQYSGSIQTGF